MSWPRLMHLALIALVVPLKAIDSHKRNYEAKYTNSNIPQWKQRACEKPQKYKANSHYTCDDKGDVKCLPGWQGDLCQVPMCRKGCDPMNGFCQRPGECRCRIGYTGEFCESCIPLPGCQQGYCTKPFECLCKPGWDGLFCTEPTCRQGCHSTRGYCETPGECRCRIGWAGRTCSECSVLPGCQHGTCSKPLECKCLPGYTGMLCQTAICAADCHKQRGYCRKPDECRCKVGWTGPNCDKCFPYPDCVNGDCEKPWECNCKSGWGGMLCNEKLTYCEDNPNIFENGGKCSALTKEDGSYRCRCQQGYLGKNCEIVDEFMLTSTAAPRITPPTPIDEEEEGDDDEDEDEEGEEDTEIDNGDKGVMANNQTLLAATMQTATTTTTPTTLLTATGGNMHNNVSTMAVTATRLNESMAIKTLDNGTLTTTTSAPMLYVKPNEANNVVVHGHDDADVPERRQGRPPFIFPTMAVPMAKPTTTTVAIKTTTRANLVGVVNLKTQESTSGASGIIGTATTASQLNKPDSKLKIASNEQKIETNANKDEEDDDDEYEDDDEEGDDDEEEGDDGDDDEEDDEDQFIPNIFDNET